MYDHDLNSFCMMMFIQLLFLLSVCDCLIKADSFSSDEAKYIDLLPEEEKRDFLDRIARRIIAEIRTRHGDDKASIEVSDESLNENDAYVKQIMDEETENMKMKRRQDDDIRIVTADDTKTAEINVQSLDNIDLKGEETLGNFDSPATENKIRIKKGTIDHVSQIPVSLLYDNERNLPVTVKIDQKNSSLNDGNEEIGRGELEVQRLDLLQTDRGNKDLLRVDHDISEKKSTEQKFEDKSEKNSDSIVKVRRKESDLNNDKVTLSSDSQQESHEGYNSSTLNDSPRIVEHDENTAPENVLVRSIEQEYAGNSAANRLKTTKADTIQDPSGNEKDFTKDVTTGDIFLVNNTSTFRSSPKIPQTLLNVASNSSIEWDVNVTESYLHSATTFGDLKSHHPIIESKSHYNVSDNVYTIDTVKRLDYDTKEEVENDDNWDKNVIKELNSNEDNKGHDQKVLRSGQTDVRGYIRQSQFKKSNLLPSHDSAFMNTYQVYEVPRNKPPFVVSEQAPVSYPEEPYYVPMYNFASENAFYNAYNRFGPNYEKEVDRTDTRGFQPKDEVTSFESNNFKTRSKNVPRYLYKDGIKTNHLGQRIFKHYRNNNAFQKQSVNYKNQINFIPLSHEKFFGINFNPSDYLDMDYYLGRSNDSPELLDNRYDNNDQTRIFPNNLKSILSHIREKVQKQNMQELRKKTRSVSKGLIKELKVTDKLLSNPIFKLHNNTLVIILPKSRTKLDGTTDAADRNIADDYYFGRMSSLEKFRDYNDEEISSADHPAKLKADDLTIHNYDYVVETDAESENSELKDKTFPTPLKFGHVVKKDLTEKKKETSIKLGKVKNRKQNYTSVLFEAHLNVLKDMVEYNDERMIHYDWLGSAVDVQSALEKLITLTNIMHLTDDVHRSDVELFKYVLFLFESSIKFLVKDDKIRKKIEARQKTGNVYGRRKMMAPISNTNHLEAWREVKNYMREIQNLNLAEYDNLLIKFHDVLEDMQQNLDEVHKAIKQIAIVTKYNQQRWFHDLKQLYLSPMNRNVSLNLLLHLSSTRLFGLIEESAKNGLEENFHAYVQSQAAEVEKTRDEFVFILRLLKEINRLKSF